MKINEEGLLFNYHLAESIGQWGHVELHVLELALSCINLAEKQAFAIAFHSIEGFRQKLNVCGNLVKHRFGKSQHFPKWRDLEERLRRGSLKRNKIVHGWHKLYVNNRAGRRWALIPIHHADGTLIHVDGEKPPTGAICLRDLVAIHGEFDDLTARVANMHNLFSRNRAPFPESDEPSKGPMSLQAIARHARLILGYQISPSKREI